jgi:hypothetical protein
LPACCCQPAVAGGIIYADLRGEFSTHLVPQALFTQSSPVLGELTLHPLIRSVCLFTAPPVLWSFPPTAAFTSFPTPGCWTRASSPARAFLVHRACLFTVPGRIPFPQSSALSAPHPLSHVSLLFLLLISQFLFFSLGGGRSVQGAMLLWPRLVCGSTAVPQSSPCLHLPKPSECRRLAAWWPSLFLHLT